MTIAQPDCRKEADHVLRTIRQHDADAVAFADAQFRERRRQSVGLSFDVAERELRSLKAGRRSVGELQRRQVEDLMDRLVREVDFRRHPEVVMLEPGPAIVGRCFG